MDKNWRNLVLTDLCMTLWNQKADELSPSNRPYVFSKANYGFIADRAVDEMMEKVQNHPSLAAEVIWNKLREIKDES